MRTLLIAPILILVLTVPAWAQVVPAFSTSRVYLTEADFNRAIQPYQQAISADARNARAQYWLGHAYLFGYRQWLGGAAPYAEGYLAKAVGPLQEAIKLEPTRPDAYIDLSHVYQYMGDYQKADEAIDLMRQRTRPGWLPRIGIP
jgi:tetratricopeptide (TPR) repeat protein